jgi:GNAT superfamily N-acetyltransferase
MQLDLFEAHDAPPIKAPRAESDDFPVIHITRAGTTDSALCQSMTRDHRSAFPFVTRAGLSSIAERGGLHIARIDGEAVGFVSFWARRDGWHTVHELCVRDGWQGVGVGRALLYSVPTPIRLKCPADLEASNRFYHGAGMERVGTEDAKRPLNIWEMRVLCIHCQGSNRSVPMWARRAGMAYGSRSVETPRAWPFMLDVDFKRLSGLEDWRRQYLPKVVRYRPVMAMALDYASPAQKADMLHMVDDLRALGVLRVVVTPKFAGAVTDIPPDCIVGISVPSSYEGYIPETTELVGRKTHLLGGSPLRQSPLISQIIGAGGVVLSADYNVHERNAQNGRYFQAGQWLPRATIAQPTRYYDEMIPYSGANIRKHLNTAAQFSIGRLL